MSGINQDDMICGWFLAMTGFNDEWTGLLLAGFLRRGSGTAAEVAAGKLLSFIAKIVGVDNCCAMMGSIRKILPETKVFQDMYHIAQRISATILKGSANSRYAEVSKAIYDCFMLTRAVPGRKKTASAPGTLSIPATFHSPEEQVDKLSQLLTRFPKGNLDRAFPEDDRDSNGARTPRLLFPHFQPPLRHFSNRGISQALGRTPEGSGFGICAAYSAGPPTCSRSERSGGAEQRNGFGFPR